MQTAEMVAGVSGAGGRVVKAQERLAFVSSLVLVLVVVFVFPIVIFPLGQNVVHAIAYISVGPIDLDLASQCSAHLAPRLVRFGRIPAANGLCPRIVDPMVDQGLE